MLCKRPATGRDTALAYLSKTPFPQHHEEIEVGEFHSVQIVGKSPLFRRTEGSVTSGAKLGFLNNKQTGGNSPSFLPQGKDGWGTL